MTLTKLRAWRAAIAVFALAVLIMLMTMGAVTLAAPAFAVAVTIVVLAVTLAPPEFRRRLADMALMLIDEALAHIPRHLAIAGTTPIITGATDKRTEHPWHGTDHTMRQRRDHPDYKSHGRQETRHPRLRI